MQATETQGNRSKLTLTNGQTQLHERVGASVITLPSAESQEQA